MPNTTSLRVNRWCYRCVDCLAVAFADVQLPYLRKNGYSDLKTVEATCAICGGAVENMGRVGIDVAGGETLREVHERCPCDMRCTHALGPHCDCRCQGENHGSQRMVTVEVIVGTVPRVSFKNDEAALQAATLWRMMRDALQKQIDELQAPRVKDGQWLEYKIYTVVEKKKKALRTARENRTHEARMRNLMEGLALKVEG